MSLIVVDAMADPDLLGGYFDGPSWSTWRAVLRAAHGLPLDDDELAAFRSVAERDPPTHRVREIWTIAGRRAGKDSVASALATTAALEDYSAILRPGERAVVLCLACDRNQARIVLGYIRGYFAERPMLKALVTRETVDGIELSNRVDIVVGTNDFRAVRGRTLVCVILDECAFYLSENSASPDFEVYNAVTPGLATLPGALLIGISSPWKRAGLLYDKWKRSYGKPDPDVLVVTGPSRAFNPTLPQSIIDEAMERDPQVARAEWLGQWRDDLAGFLSREQVDRAVDRGVTSRPRLPGKTYIAFCDLSGGVHDSSTLGIAHDDGGIATLDLLYEKRSPHSPEQAIAEMAEALKVYGLRSVTGDKYAAGFVVDRFKSHGITYRQSELNRSEIYIGALPLFTSDRARLIDNQRMVTQFAAHVFERARSGRPPEGGRRRSQQLGRRCAVARRGQEARDGHLRRTAGEIPHPRKLRPPSPTTRHAPADLRPGASMICHARPMHPALNRR